MQKIPGVQSAAVGIALPYERVLNDGITLHEWPPRGPAVHNGLALRHARYFETLQIPLLAGRTFTNSDGPGTQPVAIVNRSLSRKFFPGINPVGHTLDKRHDHCRRCRRCAASVGTGPNRARNERGDYVHPRHAGGPAVLFRLVHVWFQPSWIVRTTGRSRA